MRILIRIVFVIFIANRIDCLGGVCDDCCDCFKEKEKQKDEEEEKNENEEIAISLVNDSWYNAKKKNLVLMIFEKEENDIFKGNGDKVSFKLEGNNNPKIAYQNEKKDPLKLGGKKYVLFEIKTNTNNTLYLYCSDVESSGNNSGIFERKNHISISVIACDITNVMNMGYMFLNCNSLTKLDLKNFDTTNVKDMAFMFCECSSLTELDLTNFDTTSVTDMKCMFYGCSSLKELKFEENFNTTNVTDMRYMFFGCSSLTELNIKNFNTTNVTNMNSMFSGCRNLKELKFGEKFNTENVKGKNNMFYECDKLSDEIKVKFQIKMNNPQIDY